MTACAESIVDDAPLTRLAGKTLLLQLISGEVRVGDAARRSRRPHSETRAMDGDFSHCERPAR